MSKQDEKREMRWFRKDTGSSKAKLKRWSIEEIIKWMPKQSKLAGGTVRFPGSAMEVSAVSITCTKTFRMDSGGIISVGETFIGQGKDFKEALISAIICMYVMAHYRGTR